MLAHQPVHDRLDLVALLSRLGARQHRREQLALFVVVMLEDRVAKETHRFAGNPARLHRGFEQRGQSVEFLQARH